MLRLLIIFFTFLSTSLIAGTAASFEKIESDLIVLGKKIQSDSTDQLRQKHNEEFLKLLGNALSLPGSFDFPFTEVKTMSTITSDDQVVKLYTWVLPAVNGETYSYFGFLQTFDKKLKSHKTFPLKEKKFPDNRTAQTLELGTEEWYGSLYYKVIPVKHKRKYYYTLLGWHGKNSKTTRKLVDVLTLGSEGPKFGKAIFKIKDKSLHRLVYEYNARVVMSLNYNEAMKGIVMDHLSPANPGAEEDFTSYGPDFTYNLLYFKKGNWTLRENISVKNPKRENKGENVPLIKDKRNFQDRSN